jgi:hypothetical protein
MAYFGVSQVVTPMPNNDLGCHKSFFGLFPKSSYSLISFIYLPKSSQQMFFRFIHIDFALHRNMPEQLSQSRAPGLCSVVCVCVCVCGVYPYSRILSPDVESVSHRLHLSSQRGKNEKKIQCDFIINHF